MKWLHRVPFFPLYNSPKKSHTEHNCLSRTNEEGTLAPLLVPDFSYADKQREQMGFMDNGKVNDSSRLIEMALK